jgi:hypothetical protein
VLGRLSFEAQEQGVHHQQQHLLPFGEWCLLDLLGVTWEPPCDVELNQEVCKGKEIAYFVKIYPE